jgi:cell division initiation protein
MIDLTPLEVRKKKADFRRVMRGYEPGMVDDFLDVVADRLDQLVRDNIALKERANRQEELVAEFRERERALTEALVTAQEMREEIRRQTTREAELAKQAAEQAAQQLSALARQEVAQLKAAAEQEAAQLRSRAQQEAAQLRASAQQEAAQLRAEAQQDAVELRSTARQEREREEEALRRVRAQQQQFLVNYRTMLEREMAEVQIDAQTLGVALVGDKARPTSDGWQEARGRGLMQRPEPEPPAGGARTADRPATATGKGTAAQKLAVTAALLAADAAAVPRSQATAAWAAAERRGMFPEDFTDAEFAAIDRLDAFTAQSAAAAAAEPDAVAEPAESSVAGTGTGDATSPAHVLAAELETVAELVAAAEIAAAASADLPDEPDMELPGLDDELLALDAEADLPELDMFELEPLEPFEPEPFVVGSPSDEAAAPSAAADDLFVDSPFAAADDDLDIEAALADAEAAPLSGLPEAGEAELDLYEAVSAEPDAAGVPGPIGLGSDATVWATAPDWAIEGIELLGEESAASELPPGSAPVQPREFDRDFNHAPPPGAPRAVEPAAGTAADSTPGEAVDEADDEIDASLILRNAAAAGYRVDDSDADELLLEEVLEDEGEDDGWLDSLLDDAR